ncbi:MAG: PTS lactose/cellobiose transporter subunit IIA [Culicoidibacterales bacterium]
MDGIELAAFDMIRFSGEAKSLMNEALIQAKQNNFNESERLLKEASEFLIEGHKAHSQLIKDEARGEQISFSLLLMHAEDQLFSAGEFKVLVTELIELYRRLEQ